MWLLAKNPGDRTCILLAIPVYGWSALCRLRYGGPRRMSSFRRNTCAMLGGLRYDGGGQCVPPCKEVHGRRKLSSPAIVTPSAPISGTGLPPAGIHFPGAPVHHYPPHYYPPHHYSPPHHYPPLRIFPSVFSSLTQAVPTQLPCPLLQSTR